MSYTANLLEGKCSGILVKKWIPQNEILEYVVLF